MARDALFADLTLSAWLEERLSQALGRAGSIPRERVLNVAEPQLIGELMEEYKVVPPELQVEHRYTTGAEDTTIDVRGDRLRTALGQRTSGGTRLEVRIPFEGDPALFRLRPSIFSGGCPRGRVENQELVVWWEAPADSVDAKLCAKSVEEEIERVTKWMEWVSADCEQFNRKELEPQLKHALGQRKAKATKDRDLEVCLQIPVKRRADPNPVLEVSVKHRKKLEVLPPEEKALAKTPAPESRISHTDYADILSVVRSWRGLVERLPNTFAAMNEGFFRDVLLVVLNNQFGPVGGEVFSRKGKTDILIWHDKGAVFIAECKIWSGSKGLADAVDQLLGYLVWRDTKSALILLIREQDVTSVLNKTDVAIRGHARYSRRADDAEGFPVYVFHRDGDKRREIWMALIGVAVTPDAKGSRSGSALGGDS